MRGKNLKNYKYALVIKAVRNMAKLLGTKVIVHEKVYAGNYYNNINRVIHVSTRDRLGRARPLGELTYTAFHEIGHAMQHKRSVFMPYFTQNRDSKEFKRIALRAERSADKFAFKMCKQLNIEVQEHRYSKAELYSYFGWEF